MAKSCQPGHFVMVRMDETGERIPLTVTDFDRNKGTVTVVVQAVGKTTQRIGRIKCSIRLRMTAERSRLAERVSVERRSVQRRFIGKNNRNNS
jgi:hypothetical protein